MDGSLSIAFIGQKGLPARWGGVEAHVEAVATRLAARGHRVTAYGRRWYSGGAVELRGVSLRLLPTVRTRHLDAAVHSALAAGDALLRGFDVVHFHALGPGLFCGIPRLGRSRVVVTIHALDYRQAKWGVVGRAALKAGEVMALRLAHQTVVVSRSLQAHYAALGLSTTWIPNGVDEATPEPPHAIFSRLGLRGGDYLLFLGRWIPDRRLVEVVDAWRQAGPWPWKLVLAGDDPEGGAYGRAVRRAAAGAADILLPGMVDGVLKAELLSNAAALVSASLVEGLPIAVLEAMSYGLPCVLSDIAPHREVAADTQSALFFEAGREPSMMGALRRLSAMSPALREAAGERGRARARSAYGWESVVDQLEAVYRGP
jgi:glycosyltransferase involved in cell wall biosynthesis